MRTRLRGWGLTISLLVIAAALIVFRVVAIASRQMVGLLLAAGGVVIALRAWFDPLLQRQRALGRRPSFRSR